MKHYAETGQVLGKGTHHLEGYTLEGKGYFGPGEMPVFDRDFFEMPSGSIEDYAFGKFKEKAISDGEVSEESLAELAKHMNRSLRQVYDVADMMRLGLAGDEIDIDADYI